jgi:hypothetical protein
MLIIVIVHYRHGNYFCIKIFFEQEQGQARLDVARTATELKAALKWTPDPIVQALVTGELTGSIIWGVYRYRLHNLPLFVPPAHGLVFLTGIWIATAAGRHARGLVIAAATIAATWGLLGLFVLPRRDVAGALGVPLLLLFLWRSRSRERENAPDESTICACACAKFRSTSLISVIRESAHPAQARARDIRRSASPVGSNFTRSKR